MSVVAYYCATGDGLHHTIEIEGAGLLAWRKFSETLQPLSYVGRRRSKNEGVVDKPASIIDTLIITTFKGIAPQVRYKGGAQFDKRLAPDRQAVSVLF